MVQRAVVTSGLLWGENLSNPACGPLRPQWPRVLHSSLPLAQRPPFTSWLLSVPADVCRISFQTCFQVLVSNVRPVGFYGTKSALSSAPSKRRSSHHDTCLSTRFAFGVMVGVLVCCCCCLFVILRVNCTFEKLIGWLNIFVFFFFLLSFSPSLRGNLNKLENIFVSILRNTSSSSVFTCLPVFPVPGHGNFGCFDRFLKKQKQTKKKFQTWRFPQAV